MGLTLYDKLWDQHLVHDYGDGTGLLYVDRQILHEVSSPQAFERLRQGRSGLSMEARMTLCNMSIEAGARMGLVAPDETTFAYLAGRPYAPKDEAWTAALTDWRQLATDPDAVFDRVVEVDATTIRAPGDLGREWSTAWPCWRAPARAP